MSDQGQASSIPLYLHHLGATFDGLPDAVKALHTLQGRHRLTGEVSIDGASTVLARCVAWAMRFPKPTPSHVFSLLLEADPHEEIWTRFFSQRRMRSRMQSIAGYLVESIGPLRLWCVMQADHRGIAMRVAKTSCFGVSLPPWLSMEVVAFETQADARFQFDVEIRLAGGQRLVRYRGWLARCDELISA